MRAFDTLLAFLKFSWPSPNAVGAMFQDTRTAFKLFLAQRSKVRGPASTCAKVTTAVSCRACVDLAHLRRRNELFKKLKKKTVEGALHYERDTQFSEPNVALNSG